MRELRVGKWWALVLTGLAVVLTLTTWFSATAVAPALREDLSLSASQSAWLTSAVQVGFVLGALASSVLGIADIWRLTRVLAVASVGAGLANAVLLFEPGYGIIFFARIMTGVALALVYPPAMKFIATWFKAGRGLAMGAMVGALTLGSALPHLVRSVGTDIDWRIVIGFGSAGCLIAAVLFGFVLREGPHAFAQSRFDPGLIRVLLRNRPVMLANLGYFGHMWELYAMWGWILAYVSAANVSGLDGSAASRLAFAVIAMGGAGSVVAGWLADRIGRCNTTALAMVCSGFAALCIGFAFHGPLWLLVGVTIFWGLTVVADSAQFSAAVSELSEQHTVGTALGFQMGVGFAITVGSIWIVPQIVALLGGWRWGFLILVPGPVLGVWAMLTLRRHPASRKIANGRR